MNSTKRKEDIKKLQKSTKAIHTETTKAANKTNKKTRELLKELKQNHIHMTIFAAIGGKNGH